MDKIIKPCPWCGSTLPPTPWRTDGYKWGALQCSECSASAPEVRTGYGPSDVWYDDALKAWNKRPAERAVDELTEIAQKHNMGY